MPLTYNEKLLKVVDGYDTKKLYFLKNKEIRSKNENLLDGNKFSSSLDTAGANALRGIGNYGGNHEKEKNDEPINTNQQKNIFENNFLGGNTRKSRGDDNVSNKDISNNDKNSKELGIKTKRSPCKENNEPNQPNLQH